MATLAGEISSSLLHVCMAKEGAGCLIQEASQRRFRTTRAEHRALQELRLEDSHWLASPSLIVSVHQIRYHRVYRKIHS
jgi:hypothetical protein